MAKIDPSGSGTTRRLFTWGNSVSTIFLTTSNTVTARYIGSDISGGGNSPSVGTWHFYAITFDGSKAYYYFDGIKQGSGSSLTGASDTQNLCIGSYFQCNINGAGITQIWNGSLDDVSIYNRALSAAEVKQLYLMGR